MPSLELQRYGYPGHLPVQRSIGGHAKAWLALERPSGLRSGEVNIGGQASSDRRHR
jgi:hypothetical protein